MPSKKISNPDSLKKAPPTTKPELAKAPTEDQQWPRRLGDSNIWVGGAGTLQQLRRLKADPELFWVLKTAKDIDMPVYITHAKGMDDKGPADMTLSGVFVPPEHTENYEKFNGPSIAGGKPMILLNWNAGKGVSNSSVAHELTHYIQMGKYDDMKDSARKSSNYQFGFNPDQTPGTISDAYSLFEHMANYIESPVGTGSSRHFDPSNIQHYTGVPEDVPQAMRQQVKEMTLRAFPTYPPWSKK